jgi:diguanylate cyclase (GGDEF)-like protein
MAPDGRMVLVCSSQTRFAEQTGLALWRIPGGRDWDNEERVLASSATGIIRMILDHDSIQREMARQARTDPLTGLLNRRAFMEELARRLDRLDREGLPGTLLFVDLDHFKQLNDVRGHEAGDTALCVTATLLRDTVRPADLVARLGGDEFAIWLDGADDLAAAERAEHLRIAGPSALATLAEGIGVPLTVSIGIATRWPFRGEDIETVLHRADQAMYEVKRSGRGHWRVAHPEGT